jgi:hypothetical protein
MKESRISCDIMLCSVSVLGSGDGKKRPSFGFELLTGTVASRHAPRNSLSQRFGESVRSRRATVWEREKRLWE